MHQPSAVPCFSPGLRSLHASQSYVLMRTLASRSSIRLRVSVNPARYSPDKPSKMAQLQIPTNVEAIRHDDLTEHRDVPSNH
jgi:hypothetical protein